MAHAIWSGSINFGLVTIPVKLFTAVRTNDLSFNLLHAKDEGRIKYERVCSVDGKPVPWDEIVKGYEYEKDDYVILTDEDLQAVELDTVRTIDIETFVPRDKIEWIYLDTPYYSTAYEKIGDEAFAVIREAMKARDVVGVRAWCPVVENEP